MMYIVNLFDEINEQSQMSIHSKNITYQKENTICIEVVNSFSSKQLLKLTNIEILVNNYNEISEIFPATLINKISCQDNLIILSIDDEREIYHNNIFHHINHIMQQQQKFWADYSEQEKYEWLRACYYYNRKHEKYNKTIHISSKNIQSKNAFLCAFSEQLVGIGGYFGSDLDGFDDCFDIYDVKDITIYWRDFNESYFKEKENIVNILKDREFNAIYC